jgi:hypothetical protein
MDGHDGHDGQLEMQCQNSDVISRQRKVLRWHDVNTTRPTCSNVFQRLWQNLWFNLEAWCVEHRACWSLKENQSVTSVTSDFHRDRSAVRWYPLDGPLDPSWIQGAAMMRAHKTCPSDRSSTFNFSGSRPPDSGHSGPTLVVMVKPLASARSNIDTYIIIYWHTY